MIAAAAFSLPAPRTARRFNLAQAWHAVARGLFDSYRQERHYMRGPGPKWRAKHGMSAQAAYTAAGI